MQMRMLQMLTNMNDDVDGSCDCVDVDVDVTLVMLLVRVKLDGWTKLELSSTESDIRVVHHVHDHDLHPHRKPPR